MMPDMEKKLAFIDFLDKFKYVKRAIPLPENTKEYEDDAQHSWHLAMMVVMLHKEYPELNLERCLLYALIHDLPELYAGDTPAFDKEGVKTKNKREAQAIQKLLEQLDENNKVFFEHIFDEYENKKTPEARFVNGLDKIHPSLMCILEGNGKAWKDQKITAEMVVEWSDDKIDDEFGIRTLAAHYHALALKKKLYYKEN